MLFLAVCVHGDHGLGVAHVFRDRLCLPVRLREPRASVVQGTLPLLLAPSQERGHHLLRLHGRCHRLAEVQKHNLTIPQTIGNQIIHFVRCISLKSVFF